MYHVTWYKLFFHLAMGLGVMLLITLLFTALLLSLLIPHFEIAVKVKPWIIPIVFTSIGILFLISGSVGLDFSERYKKQNSVIYATNGETNETFWSTYENTTDEWTVNFLTQSPDTGKLTVFYPTSGKDYLINIADTDQLPIPVIETLRDTVVENSQILKLHLKSVRKANYIYAYIKTDSKAINAGI